MSTVSPIKASAIRVPLSVQVFAWVLGIVACAAGMMNLIAEWSLGLATLQFFLLVVAPVLWMIERRRVQPASQATASRTELGWAWLIAVLVAAISWTMSSMVGAGMTELPPAYHDEYSYLFESKLLLTGRLSTAGHPTHPELFDQMHVMNEGRMASRYYPGTALWIAPFLASGHIYWAPYLASAIASVFVFWTGFELGRLRVACISGFACALSPGVALFGNLLLAHQPTLAALCIFLWALVKWQRSPSILLAFIAGCALSFAMLCRPATAAGFGLPFGIAFVWQLLARSVDGPLTRGTSRLGSLLAIGIPLVLGWCVMAVYNHDVTGSWTSSPYQLYTQIYTPRHVYGFNNGDRGDAMAGPKVIPAYNRWAENLTLELAVRNLVNRWLSSWMWVFDLLPLLISFVVVVGVCLRIDRRWLAVVFAILSLHAMHFPYWYTGIMGWHYVFETAPLWCLVLGLATDLLLCEWRAAGRWVMPAWWGLLLVLSLVAEYVPIRLMEPDAPPISRVARAISTIRYPRRQYAEFNQWLETQVTQRPALVLIEIDRDDQHMDFVDNVPGLTASVLRGRYLRGVTDLESIKADFPDRTIYLCRPARHQLELLHSP